MKATDVLTLAVVAAGAYAAYRAIKVGTDAAGAVSGWLDSAGNWATDAVDAVVTAPGKIADSLVNGTSMVSDRDAGGFLKIDPQWTDYTPDYSRNRDARPLVEYFRAYGNTAATRASASAAGWTQHEISAAVGAMTFEG